MGGLGSGRPGRRATVEGTGALELDASAVVRPALEALRRAAPGFAIPEGRWLDLPEGRVVWSRGGEPWAEVEVGLRLGPDWARRGCATTSGTSPAPPARRTRPWRSAPRPAGSAACAGGGAAPRRAGAAPSSTCPTAAGGC